MDSKASRASQRSRLNEETEVLRQRIIDERKLIFEGLRIDEHKRIVVRKYNEIELTYTEGGLRIIGVVQCAAQ